MKITNRLICLIICSHLSACSLLLRPAKENFANSLTRAILNQNDTETVRQGAPAYLLLLDSLIAESPQQIDLLLTGAKLYQAYASVFVTDPLRYKRFSEKSFSYSLRALCLHNKSTCDAYKLPFKQYQDYLDNLKEDDIVVLYTFAASWAAWVQAHSDNLNARANLPKIEAAMHRIIALDDTYMQGYPHLYTAVLSIILPPALGGKPEQALQHFQHALALSEQRNLMFKVIFAEKYARMLFDRELHDRLLNEVLAADPEVPQLTLMNTIAQQKAKILLQNANQYF